MSQKRQPGILPLGMGKIAPVQIMKVCSFSGSDFRISDFGFRVTLVLGVLALIAISVTINAATPASDPAHQSINPSIHQSAARSAPEPPPPATPREFFNA